MSVLAGLQLFMIRSSPAPAVVKNRNALTPKITALTGAARKDAPLFPDPAPGGLRCSGPPQATVMRSSWFCQVPPPSEWALRRANLQIHLSLGS